MIIKNVYPFALNLQHPVVDKANVQLQAYDVHKTLSSRTPIDFKNKANDFKTTYKRLQKLILTKDTEKVNQRSPSDSPATKDTGESNESGKETKVNGFAIAFLEEILEFLREKFTLIPWSKKRLEFAV